MTHDVLPVVGQASTVFHIFLLSSCHTTNLEDFVYLIGRLLPSCLPIYPRFNCNFTASLLGYFLASHLSPQSHSYIVPTHHVGGVIWGQTLAATTDVVARAKNATHHHGNEKSIHIFGPF